MRDLRRKTARIDEASTSLTAMERIGARMMTNMMLLVVVTVVVTVLVLVLVVVASVTEWVIMMMVM